MYEDGMKYFIQRSVIQIVCIWENKWNRMLLGVLVSQILNHYDTKKY